MGIVRGLIIQGGIVWRAIVLRRNCSGGNCPRWQMSGGQLSRRELSCSLAKDLNRCAARLHSRFFIFQRFHQRPLSFY